MDREKATRLKQWAGDVLDAAILDGDNLVEAIAGGLGEKLGLALPGTIIYISIMIHF